MIGRDLACVCDSGVNEIHNTLSVVGEALGRSTVDLDEDFPFRQFNQNQRDAELVFEVLKARTRLINLCGLTIVNRLNHSIVSEAGVREFASTHICNAKVEALCLWTRVQISSGASRSVWCNPR